MVSIRVRTVLIVAFAIASGMPLLTFWAWPHSAALQAEMKSANDRHLLLALNAAEDLQDYHANVAETVRAIAPLLSQGVDPRFAVPLLTQLRFRYFAVVDPLTGALSHTIPVEVSEVPASLPPDLLREVTVVADAAPGAMSPVRIAEDGQPELLLALRQGDRIVLASLGTGYVRELSARIVFGLKGHAVVIDQTGHVIAHPRPDWVESARDMGGLVPVQQVLAGISGVRTFFSPALEADVIAGIAPVPGIGWGVLVPQPISELHAAAARIARSARVVFLTGLGLSALIAVIFSGLMSKGIRAVSVAARQMAHGDDKVRIRPLFRSLTLTEIEELRTSFNTMAQEVGESRRTLLTMVTHDSLTGLLNRRAFMTAGTDLIDRAAGSGTRFVMFFIDVDHFKAINDVHGHAAGDDILVAVAQRLRALAGPDDLIALQSGDEFLLLHLLRPREKAETFGRALADALAEDHAWNGRRLAMTCSVGGCPGSESGLVMEQLIRCADQAMYMAKEHGRGGLCLFDARVQAECRRRERLLTELKASILGGRVAAAYQPILDAQTGQLAGFEALARWPRPAGQEVSVQQFIALAEESGLIGALGAAVRRQALAFAAELRRNGCAVPISVNVSRHELCAPGFEAELDKSLRAAGLTPESIILEITESIFADRSGAVGDCLRALRQAGYRLSLDDFGKGFSAHGLLEDLSFERMKIDMTFVGEVPGNPRATAVVGSLIDLGRRLDLRITLEGIACPDAAAFARASGVHEVQGYLYSRPLAGLDALAFALDDRQPGAPLAHRQAATG